MDARVTLVMPWMRAFPDRVALQILSTELGEVNTYLYAFESVYSGNRGAVSGHVIAFHSLLQEYCF